jgi:hypothetical protein
MQTLIVCVPLGSGNPWPAQYVVVEGQDAIGERRIRRRGQPVGDRQDRGVQRRRLRDRDHAARPGHRHPASEFDHLWSAIFHEWPAYLGYATAIALAIVAPRPPQSAISSSPSWALLRVRGDEVAAEPA